MIEAFLKKRAKDLEKGIGELLRDPTVLTAVYNHSLVNGLYEGADFAQAKKAGKLPSYIPARNFALALMDVAFASGAQGATPQPATTPVAVAAGGAAVPAPVAPAQVNVGAPAVAAAAPVAIGNANLVQTLRLFAQAAGLDPAKTRENIENWYNTSMDRVSGWYKRRAQWCLLVIGLVLAIAMNVDAIRVARELSLNKTLREAVVQKAIAFDKAHPQPNPQEARKDLEGLGVPIGWTPPYDCDGWTVVGWIITAFAVSLGAPFWFDTLNKFIVVRSTVKPDEKSGTEAPKEPTK
jgi:hypothetical protein